MFLSKQKQVLKDKEAGLVFSWRNPLTLNYPLLFFLFLSLLAHFLFFHLFQLPALDTKQDGQQTGTLFYLNEDGGLVTQRLLSLIQHKGALIPRGTPDVDPLAKGIDDQLSPPLTAGLLEWSPEPLSYPDQPFEGGNRMEIVWKNTLPPVESVAQVQPSSTIDKSHGGTDVSPHFLSLPAELKAIMGPRLPQWKSDDHYYGKYMEFMVVVSPQGKVTLVTPLNEPEKKDAAFRQTERWIRALPWKASPQGAKGIISVEWREGKQ